jgi:hypothetical protein
MQNRAVYRSSVAVTVRHTAQRRAAQCCCEEFHSSAAYSVLFINLRSKHSVSQVRIMYRIVLSFHLQVTSSTSATAFHWLESGIFVASSYNSVDNLNIFNVNLLRLSVVLQTCAAVPGLWIVFLCLTRFLGQIILLSHCPYVHRTTHKQVRPILVYSFLHRLGFEAANPVIEV